MKVSAAVLCTAFLAIYAPDIGHGFIQDDFAWIHQSGVGDLRGAAALFGTSLGFYRPMVSTTFALDAAVWNLNPFGYGLTNLLLCVASALLLFAVARRLDLPAPAALLTTGVWAFNFHGINMALLWVSGRTALLASACALAATYAFLRARYLTAGALCLGALLSKEETVMLPAILAGFVVLPHQTDEWRIAIRTALARTWPLWVALGIYVVLRVPSGAFGPADAPPYYRFSFSAPLVARNILEYLDRAGTVALLAAVVLMVTFRRRLPAFLPVERRALLFSALWFAGMYALTLFLPSRSSLYAVLPSSGSAIAAGVCASAVTRADPRRFKMGAGILIALAIILIPIYRLRNDRWVVLADTSSSVLRTLQFAAASRPAGGTITLVDDPARRLDATFGALFPDAIALFLGPRWSGEIDEEYAPRPASDLVFRYEAGAVVPFADEP